MTTATEPTVYAIVSPSLRARPTWPRVRAVVQTKAKRATVAEFGDVFASHADYQATWEQKLAGLAGAIVVPFRFWDAQWLGRAAQREADHLAKLNKPVFLLDQAGLIPWPAVRVTAPDRHPAALPLKVTTPAPAATGERD